MGDKKSQLKSEHTELCFKSLLRFLAKWIVNVYLVGEKSNQPLVYLWFLYLFLNHVFVCYESFIDIQS